MADVSGSQEENDRAAIEQITGVSMAGEWPAEAMPVGTRVRVIKDELFAGPWQQVFTGTIDATVTPFPVQNLRARPGELNYAVAFDEPQLDVDGDGPYRKAVIWSRYLEAL